MEEKKKIFHSRHLFYGFMALLLAISTAHFLFAGEVKYIVFDVLILVCFIFYCIFAKKFKSLIVVLCLFAVGLGWFFVGLSLFEGKKYDGQCTVVARVSDDTHGSLALLKDVYINGEKAGNINLTVDSAKELNPGDVITFYAEVENVKLFTLGSFNSFYYRDRAPYSCKISDFEVIDEGDLRFDEIVRLKMKDVLYENLGQEQGAVAFAVLFGDKSDVDFDTKMVFKEAGVIHVLTVSGLHVSFLIVLLGWILRKCRVKRLLNFIVCGVFLALYAYFCSFSPSILRAGVMGLVLLSTKLCGKQYDGLNSLGLAGIIILFFMPLAALDLGFLMSFFCVLAIYTITPLLTKLFKKFFPKFVAESFGVSVGVQFGILPFLAMMESSFNFLTFFTNLIIIPIFSIVYPALFVCSIIALVPFLGFVLKPCGWGLVAIKEIAAFFATTHIKVDLEPFDIFMVAFAFVGFFLLSRYFMRSKKVKAVCCCSVFALSGLFCGLSFVQFPQSSSISYCFAGGTGHITLSTASGQTAVVDMAEGFTKRVLRRLDLKRATLSFVLQRSQFNYSVSRELGAEYVVRNDAGEGYEEEILLAGETFGSFGDFSFRYRYFGNRQIGLEIAFDEIKVFVLRDRTTSDVAINSLSSEKFDFVLLGKQDYGGAFNENAIVLSYYNTSFSDASFEKDGNIAYRIDGKNFQRRCLD